MGIFDWLLNHGDEEEEPADKQRRLVPTSVRDEDRAKSTNAGKKSPPSRDSFSEVAHR
jgi:hypothetical protein